MRTFAKPALTISLTATLLVGCGSSQPIIGGPGTMSQNQTIATKSFQVLHTFGGADGEQPQSGLVDVSGTLYGTTAFGGSHGYGVVYRISTTGAEKVLHNFAGGSDGANPLASLIYVKGLLYGTTSQGGNSGCLVGYGCGTVYRISSAGSEKVLYRFAGGSDGANPQAGLVNVNGTLYGTAGGGSSKDGVVYRITTGGAEKVIYSFAGGSDGAGPMAGLINVKGILYGTTSQDGGSPGYGTVYRVTTAGVEKVLHTFTGPDGGNPRAGLIEVKGALYGTTSAGGGSGCPKYMACGTVYRITTSGTLKTLHTFGGGSDGLSPYSALTDVNDVLYGTTDEGGGAGCYSLGCGTIYRISMTGSEKVLHAFTGGSGGSNPYAGLTFVKNTLYGTTLLGFGSSGCSSAGCGTVFAMTP